MNDTRELLSDIRAARERLLRVIETVGGGAAAPGEWTARDILEHLVLAEHAGIRRIWDAADSPAGGAAPDASPNRGMPIEEIVAKTWKPKETAPPAAIPSGEGPLPCWIHAFRSSQDALEALGKRLAGRDLETIVAPHFLCGPLDAIQRLEFIRFHIDRHREQLERLGPNPIL